MKKLLITTSAIFLMNIVFAQTMGTFTDPRDGKTYKTVSYEVELKGGITTTMTWFAENLNYKTEGSYCYDDISAYCDKYGRLYEAEVAMKACPQGWHVPSVQEYRVLIELYGGADLINKQHNPAANALKSKEGWYNDRNGNNESGFNILPGGKLRMWPTFDDNIFKNPGYSGIGKIADFWTSKKSTKKDLNTGDYSYTILWLEETDNVINLVSWGGGGFLINRHSVRCLKD